jgi:hypothetical protein
MTEKLTSEDITGQDPQDKPWLDRTWCIVKSDQHDQILFLEDHGDGTYTNWKASMYGPLGTRGTLTPNVQAMCGPVSEADQPKLKLYTIMLEQSNRLANTVAGAMSNGKDQKQ